MVHGIHKLYWSKVQGKVYGFLDTAKIIIELLDEGLGKYGNNNRYRFTLNEIMRRLEKSQIKFSRRNASRVANALLTENSFDYYSNPANGRTVYEIVLDREKIEELERML